MEHFHHLAEIFVVLQLSLLADDRITPTHLRKLPRLGRTPHAESTPDPRAVYGLPSYVGHTVLTA